MSDEVKAFLIWAAIVLYAASIVIFTSIGRYQGRTTIRCEAVKAGVAHWTSAKDGDVKFEWIIPNKGEIE